MDVATKENDTIEDLTSLRDRLTELFGESVHDLGTALYDVVIKDDHEKLAELLYALGDNLETDSLQKVYQYYLADREEKHAN